MPRYFIELSYKGTGYAGFQIQNNANSIQAEVEKALQVYYKNTFQLTGSSRTDAGVHALQNFFHFDVLYSLDNTNKDIYHLNAILPEDIVVKSILQVADDAHCRFDAQSRSYKYHIYQYKNPFLQHTAFYYPYPIDIPLLQQAAAEIMAHNNFTTFSKKHSQVKTFECAISESRWEELPGQQLLYTVTANRFLRGMVKGLVGTMLLVGKGKITLEQFKSIIQSYDNTRADFSVSSQGLFLARVKYPPSVFPLYGNQ
jgi:tRNA pseudouridine38-40 synthase